MDSSNFHAPVSRSKGTLQRNLAIVPICLALFSQGLTFYFTVSSLTGIHSAALTAGYQISLILVSLLTILLTRISRRNFFHLEAIDLLLIAFVVIFLFDATTTKNPETSRGNLFIYFGVCWGASSLARSLSLEQFKVFCRTSGIVASLTSVILTFQVLSGTAAWVGGSGERLAIGTTGNPTLGGYTGAFAFLAGLIFFVTDKPILKPVWVVGAGAGLFVCFTSGTRSAIVAIMIAGFLILSYILSILLSSNRTAAHFVMNTALVVGTVLFMLVLLDPVLASHSTPTGEPVSPIIRVIQSTQHRVMALFQVVQGGQGDPALEERRAFYTNAWNIFLKNPVWGGGVYSSGNAHNAFLQVAAEFGIFGIMTFFLPLFYLGYQVFESIHRNLRRISLKNTLRHPSRLVRSDYSIITYFAIVFLVQTLCLFSFHGTPYTNTLPVFTLGLLIAFSRITPDRSSISSRHR